MSDEAEPLPDTLTQRIGVLARRETEARVLAPVIEALAGAFGRDQVLDIVRDTIIRIANEQGGELAEAMGGDGSGEFLDSMKYWRQDGALEIDVLEHTDAKLDFNVTRCRYAEMYRALGIPELGAILSCNRDFAFAEGFNKDAKLTRTQTILSGAGHCDFRFRFPEDGDG
ncbi:MAG: L-2-amino-thiazoline-4-carboxylic acid hydrolase [Minwuia sp.]|uniref:L-2-amino-thiazoline-4-carboxylic acid hydrolase n=1 Tax=Minwuia sp. TaxID=2493630 RepID=UPI003A8801AD